MALGVALPVILLIRRTDRHDPGETRSQEPGDELRRSGVRARVSRLLGVGCDVEAQAASWKSNKKIIEMVDFVDCPGNVAKWLR